MARSATSSARGPTGPVVLGVDVGTTATKAVAFDTTSAWQHVVSVEYPLLHPHPGEHVQDPGVVLRAVGETVRACVEATGAEAVVALSLSTAAHALMGLDTNGHPLTPLITWADSRSRHEARTLHSQGLAGDLHQRTGTPVHPMTPLTKLMWFHHQRPEIASHVHWWVGLKDYVLLYLTGRLVTELSSASATGMFDIRAQTWDPEALRLAGVPPDRLPMVIPTTATLPLAAPVASAAGLPAGLPVVVGAIDGPLATLGVGAVAPGDVGLSIGTSGAARMLVDRPTTHASGRLFCYALTERHWVIGGATSNGGSVARWARRVLADTGDDNGGDPDEAFLALAGSVPAGSEGVVFLPYLLPERAPLWNPDLPGAYLGLRQEHTSAHLARASIEGVALQLSLVVDQLAEHQPVNGIRATGGVFRSALWRHIVASVLDRPVAFSGGTEGTARGAAALALYALGHASDLAGAVDLLQRQDNDDAVETLQPDPADSAAYADVRRSVPALLEALTHAAQLYTDRPHESVVQR